LTGLLLEDTEGNCHYDGSCLVNSAVFAVHFYWFARVVNFGNFTVQNHFLVEFANLLCMILKINPRMEVSKKNLDCLERGVNLSQNI